MQEGSVTQADLTSWVEKSLRNENFIEYEINFTGKTEKGDGYASEIVFVNVNGITRTNDKRIVDLVIKHGKSNAHLRETMPMKHIFEAEIHFYDKIVPALRRFQEQKNIRHTFESVPKCYLTLVLDSMEVIILENLRKQGYELHDRLQPLDSDHLKLLLREYGKYHAFSFALRSQRGEEFKALTGDLRENFAPFFSEESVKVGFQKTVVDVLNAVRKNCDPSLLGKLKEFEKVVEKGSANVVLDLFREVEPQSVIIHGDCCNNNFMFKYKNESQLSPSAAKILDWQLVTLRSPAIDISYVIYVNSSQKELEKLDELLDAYYSSFSHFLREAGCNPDELFPFADLVRHWKKYSIFGVVMAPFILKFALCDKTHAPDLESFSEDQELGSLMDIEISNEAVYYERSCAVFKHYIEYNY